MKAVEIQGKFGLDRLVVTDRAESNPGPGQVRVALSAVSLNYRDLLTVTGKYNPKQPLPLIPCSDGVGEVVAVGDGVSTRQPGERVMPIFAQDWLAGPPHRDALRSTLGGPLDGTLTESIVLPASGVVSVPDHLSDEEAACLPCAAVTAWSALVSQASVQAGDVVLVQGTGGVSLFALQFARLLGAQVIVTSSRDDKLERARELGAWQTINYVKDPDWGKRARAYTDGRGVDLIVEVGGAGTLAQSLRAVTVGGQISMIGNLAGNVSELNVIPLVMQSVRLQGILVGNREGFESMNRAISAHRIRPVVDRVFSFDQVREAFEHMASGTHFGKIGIRIAS